jgi:uncharacterized membrane protein YfcA
MSLDFIILLALGAIAGGFINGLAGFGFWLQIMQPVQAVLVVLVMAVLSGIQGAILVRKSIRWPRLGRFLLPAIIGIPIGTALVVWIDPTLLKLVIAAFLILYGLFFAFRRELPAITRPTPVIDGTIGFAGGVLGGLAGLSGALPTMWCAMRPWPKAEQRAVLQPYNLAVQTIAILVFLVQGAFDRETLVILAVATPFTFAAAQVGLHVFKRMGDAQFRRLLIVLMLASGLILMARELIFR